TTLTQSIASMDRMFELMDEKYEVQNKPNAMVLPAAKGKLQFDHVTFKYDKDGNTILNEVDFTIEPGQTVAFVGMSGGGKSTIVSLIPRFYDVTEGSIRIDGHDLRDVQLKSLRDQIGLVLQDSILFSRSEERRVGKGWRSLQGTKD